MRWPWQRGAAEPRTDRAPGEPAAPAAVEPPVAPAGWAFLPALQRTAGSIELMSDADHFTGSLASWGDPSFTGPMTHLVSTEAPAGVIDVDGGGPVTGSGGYAASPVEMTLLPPPVPRVRPAPGRPAGTPASVQRAGSDGGQAGTAWDSSGTGAAAPPTSTVIDGSAPTHGTKGRPVLARGRSGAQSTRSGRGRGPAVVRTLAR